LLYSGEESSLREGFFSRRSNLTTIANSVRFKIASCLIMTTVPMDSVYGSLSKDLLILFKVFRYFAVLSTGLTQRDDINYDTT